MATPMAVVLSGAAARGAFQAGALQTLLPALIEQGYDPRIFLGTSAGSINAALWGQYAHLGPTVAGGRVVQTWSRMGQANVIANPVRTVLFGGAPRFLASTVGIGGGLSSLLDTSPLVRTANEELDAAALARNVRDGVIDAIGVVGTRIPPPASSPAHEGPAHARSVVFIDSTLDIAAIANPERAIDVAPGPIEASHVLASSAIPIGFPPVWVERPQDVRGWYSDGGVRLNTPLRPAIELGAERILVVSAMSINHGSPLPPSASDERIPNIADTTAQVLHAVLGDQMACDLRSLRAINREVAHCEAQPELSPPRRPDGTEAKAIPLMTVAPLPGELAVLAEKIVAEARRGSILDRIRDADLLALDRLLRGFGDGAGRRELLSYVLFNEDYFAAQIALGRTAAQRALDNGWTED